jgi:hypothetical protein
MAIILNMLHYKVNLLLYVYLLPALSGVSADSGSPTASPNSSACLNLFSTSDRIFNDQISLSKLFHSNSLLLLSVFLKVHPNYVA